MDLSENIDLKACLRGDPRAWEAFVRLTGGVIHGAVRRAIERRSGLAAEIEDDVQEVFARLVREDFRLLRRFDPARASLATFLMVVARTVVHERTRRKSLRIARGVDTSGISRGEPAAQPDVDLPWHVLTEQQRRVLQLLYEQGFSVEQAAARLGVDPQTVRSAKHKGLARLRSELLTARGDESPGKRIPDEDTPHGSTTPSSRGE